MLDLLRILLRWRRPLIVFTLVGSVAFGALLGMFNGILVWKLDIPPIVVTLGTMTIFRGTIFLLTDGKWVNSHEMSDTFKAFPRFEVLGLPEFLLALLAGQQAGGDDQQIGLKQGRAGSRLRRRSRAPWGRRPRSLPGRGTGSPRTHAPCTGSARRPTRRSSSHGRPRTSSGWPASRCRCRRRGRSRLTWTKKAPLGDCTTATSKKRQCAP